MKKTTLAVLVGGSLWGAAAGTTSAAITPDFYTASSIVDLLARKGVDNPRPPRCYDHRIDLCKSVGEDVARGG
jgi:hypothetical protein